MALTKATFRMTNGAMINVLDFGATGDGTTDDTAAFQAALANGGKMIFVPRGQYLISSEIQVGRGQSMVGESINAGPGSASKLLMSGVGTSLRLGAEAYVENLVIEGTNSADVGVYIVANNHYCSLRNLYIEGFTDVGLLFQNNTFSQAIYNVNCESNGTNIKVDSAAGSAATLNFFACEANNATSATGYNLHAIGAGINWHGGALQNGVSGAKHLLNDEGQVAFFGAYFEGISDGAAFTTNGTTNTGTMTVIYHTSNMQFGDDGFIADGEYARVVLQDVEIRGSGSTNNTLFDSRNGAVIQTSNVRIISYDSGESNYVEFVSQGAGHKTFPHIAKGARLIGTLAADDLLAIDTTAQVSGVSKDATTAYTQSGGSYKIVCNGNTPNVTFDLLDAFGGARLYGLQYKPLLIQMIARFDHNSTGNSFMVLEGTSSNFTSNAGASDSSSDSEIDPSEWAYYALYVVPNTNTPSDMNIRVLLSANATGTCTDNVFIDRIDVYALDQGW